MCPLLAQTPDGLRCSVDTADVRPFWGRALGFYGGAAAALYMGAVIAVFAFLRTVGYPVSILHVGLPPLWHKVGQARGWFFLEKSNRAFEESRTLEGLLYLENAYRFDPANYAAGLSLAKKLQPAHAAQSDKVYLQLLREHPDKARATAQEWFRALVARGSFERIAELARDELQAKSPHAAVWVRALVFAARQLNDDRILRELVASPMLELAAWRQVFETELLLRAGKHTEARAALERPWPANAPAFTLFYRVNTLIDLRDAFGALDLLKKFPGVLDDEAVVTLELRALAINGSKLPLQHAAERLLASAKGDSSLAVVKVLCAHLIRHPDPVIFERLLQHVKREKLPLTTETAGAWFSVLCTAGTVGDYARLHELTAELRQASGTPFHALRLVEAFFRGEIAERRVTLFLPVLPLPLEVTYALHERYAATPATMPSPKRA